MTHTTSKKQAATIAAWDWVGTYEANDPETPEDEHGYSITLEEAFNRYKTAARVKRAAPDFPEDMVDAYAMLRRMSVAQQRAARR